MALTVLYVPYWPLNQKGRTFFLVGPRLFWPMFPPATTTECPLPKFPPAVSGFGFGNWDFGFRVLGFKFQVLGFGFQVSGFVFQVPGSRFWVSGLGCRVRLMDFGGCNQSLEDVVHQGPLSSEFGTVQKPKAIIWPRFQEKYFPWNLGDLFLKCHPLLGSGTRDDELESLFWEIAGPHGGVRPFHQKSTCFTQ